AVAVGLPSIISSRSALSAHWPMSMPQTPFCTAIDRSGMQTQVSGNGVDVNRNPVRAGPDNGLRGANGTVILCPRFGRFVVRLVFVPKGIKARHKHQTQRTDRNCDGSRVREPVLIHGIIRAPVLSTNSTPRLAKCWRKLAGSGRSYRLPPRERGVCP